MEASTQKSILTKPNHTRMHNPKTLISWNVNGIRAVLKKGFESFLERTNADVVCLQETKISSDLIQDFSFLSHPYSYWNCAEKKGYSGTAILSKIQPISVKYGIGTEQHDQEGRVLTAEFEDYYLVTVYTPNSKNHDASGRPARLDYRTQEWDLAFLDFITDLENHKPVVFCGDLNVAHTEIDLANPKTNRKNAGFTDEERERFGAILKAGFIDTFRHFNPEKTDAYTWWSYRARARERNIGWRIDYFCVSALLKESLVSSEIMPEVLGSDHCPIALNLS